MTQFEQLDTILEGQRGMLQTSEVVKRGIPKSVFYNYVKEKELEQAAHGVYVSPDAWVDGMYLLHLRCSQGIFSHETALFFHDLTDREPSPYSITVRRGYSTTRLKADGVFVYTIKPELHGVGKSTAVFGDVIMIKTARQMKDLIRNLTREKSADAQILMRNYMMERFLERISLSECRDNFILKGGIRVSMATVFDGVVTPLKIDISTGDVITPRAVRYSGKQPYDAGALVRLPQEIFLCG